MRAHLRLDIQIAEGGHLQAGFHHAATQRLKRGLQLGEVLVWPHVGPAHMQACRDLIVTCMRSSGAAASRALTLQPDGARPPNHMPLAQYAASTMGLHIPIAAHSEHAV